MKRNAFGQLFGAAHPGLRFAGDGGDGGGGDDKPKEFTPPKSQEEFDRIISDRAARAERQAREDERKKFADYDTYKADAEKFRAAEAAAKPKEDDKPTPGVSEGDVDKRINDALAAERLELALERVNDQLDKALEGRTFAASLLLSLDRKQFVKDGKAADTQAIKDWVKDNSKEIEQPDPKRRPIPGQGDRDANATGGSVQAGRDRFNDQNKTKSRKD